ncbi:hypothetical protein Scep_019706 [Stephania cephalantha]|uniref:Uncharacterized protein n=1 Tax=Stephania cephalantha TaxID=152367 RepID=A0AAP0IBT4_9MAGN
MTEPSKLDMAYERSVTRETYLITHSEYGTLRLAKTSAGQSSERRSDQHGRDRKKEEEPSELEFIVSRYSTILRKGTERKSNVGRSRSERKISDLNHPYCGTHTVICSFTEARVEVENKHREKRWKKEKETEKERETEIDLEGEASLRVCIRHMSWLLSGIRVPLWLSIRFSLWLPLEFFSGCNLSERIVPNGLDAVKVA